MDRLLAGMIRGFIKLTLRMLFGVRLDTPKAGIDRHQTFELSASEAATGVEKAVIIKNGLKVKS